MQQSNPVGVFILHIKINQLHQCAALSLGKTQYAHSERTRHKDRLCVAGNKLWAQCISAVSLVGPFQRLTREIRGLMR